MNDFGNIDSVLAAIDPASVGSFLVREGYGLVGSKPEIAEIYESAAGVVLLLPADQRDRGYTRKLRDLLEVFVDSTMTLDDVVASVVLPNSDIFRYRIETPESVWGQLRLSYTQEAMQALFTMLRFTAAGVSSRKLDYRGGISESAKGFADQCRFGQTEYGSFVLKVFCPAKPIGLSDSDLLGEPFGRATTRALLENFAFLSSAKSEDLAEPLPPTLNRQVADAVARLQPRLTLGLSTEVGMRFAKLPRRDDENAEMVPRAEVQTLDLGPFVYSRAQAVRDRLRKAEEFERELLRGYIVNLHKDRPIPDSEQSHEITLEVKAGSNWRLVRLRLLPPQYRQALKWQDANSPVDLDAVIDKRGQVWVVANMYGFHAAGPSQEPGLFGPDD